MSEPKLLPIHTTCRDCCLALLDQVEEDGKVVTAQVGCGLGRLDAFRAQGGPDAVVDAYDDADNRFCIINGRVCNAFRDNDWGVRAAPDDPVTRVRQEVCVRLAAVVIVPPAASEADVLATAEALVAQSVPPSEVFWVHGTGSAVSPGRLVGLLNKSVGNALTWRIVLMTDAVDRSRAVDAAVERIEQSGWYAVFAAGYRPANNFVSGLNDALNVRMERFSFLRPDADGNAEVAQVAFHRHPLVAGNTPMYAEAEDGTKLRLATLLAKAEHYAAAEGKHHLVRDAAEVLA